MICLHPDLEPEIVIIGLLPNLFGFSVRNVHGPLADIFGVVFHNFSLHGNLQHGDADFQNDVSSCVRPPSVSHMINPDPIPLTGLQRHFTERLENSHGRFLVRFFVHLTVFGDEHVAPVLAVGLDSKLQKLMLFWKDIF